MDLDLCVYQAEKFFKGSKYNDIVEMAKLCLDCGKLEECKKALSKLPTKEQLLSKLVESLSGKSVYRSLKSINEGKSEYSLKAISSLCTHVAIEIERGNVEYKCLLPNIMEKINAEVYKVLNK